MNCVWFIGQLGIAVEAIGAIYLVIIARRSKVATDKLGITSAGITYEALGPVEHHVLPYSDRVIGISSSPSRFYFRARAPVYRWISLT